ncbi:MAG: type II toxin-antitoxin system prevent-host-death family antitoxin [Candidatus Humimicrobiaceae bacterium]
MIINSTDLKNNLGKYLRECTKGEIIISNYGRTIAKLCPFKEDSNNIVRLDGAFLISDEAAAFNYKPKKISYEEFLKLTENNEDRYEYIDGELYQMISPKTPHQKALGELYMLFYNWFKGKKCQPMLSPYDITLKRNPDNVNVVEPDLMVICDLDEKLNERGYYMGAPALVVEIISEFAIRRDAIKKLDLYMSTGVNEYWIVNPLNKEITIYLFEQNDISQSTTYKNHETAVSYIFNGLKIRLKDVFK